MLSLKYIDATYSVLSFTWFNTILAGAAAYNDFVINLTEI